MAPNFKAILNWFQDNRPDIPKDQIESMMSHAVCVLLMAGAFEAGREFQNKNPQAGKFLDPLGEYQ